jgi:hypothetical protein
MGISKIITVIALTGSLLAAAAPASAHGHCVRAGASATAVTSDLSTVLAKEALYQSNMFAGRKGKGHVSVSCNYLGVVTKCTARQVACK